MRVEWIKNYNASKYTYFGFGENKPGDKFILYKLSFRSNLIIRMKKIPAEYIKGCIITSATCHIRMKYSQFNLLCFDHPSCYVLWNYQWPIQIVFKGVYSYIYKSHFDATKNVKVLYKGYVIPIRSVDDITCLSRVVKWNLHILFSGLLSRNYPSTKWLLVERP